MTTLADLFILAMSDADAKYQDEYEHYNYDQEKAIKSGHSGKQRSKKEAEMNTNRHNPGGHERKITTKLQNSEKNTKEAAAAEVAKAESGKNKAGSIDIDSI